MAEQTVQAIEERVIVINVDKPKLVVIKDAATGEVLSATLVGRK